jgi:hypothetical protein
MKARKLTTKFVENFPAPEAGRDSYPDTYLRRLVLRVRSTGAKTWAVVKRVKGTGRQRSMAVSVRAPLLPGKIICLLVRITY